MEMKLALLTLVAAWLPASQPQEPEKEPAQEPMQIGVEVGEVFPDIELPTIDGKSTVRLSELRGKRVLLIEFASW